ncbi:Patched family protein [Brugia pahangi]
MNSILPPIDRMSSSLQAITYATVQAAVTTLICVLPLYFYNVYMLHSPKPLYYAPYLASYTLLLLYIFLLLFF